jgi:hypothetical protein
MEDKMAELKGIVRDYVRMRNIKRATVMEFGKLITPSPGQSEYLQEIWGEDPVHYMQEGYSMAAAGLESLIYEKKAEEQEDGSRPNPKTKKPRLDLTKNRPAWCMGSVAEAVRCDGPSSSGRWMGRGRAAPRGGSSSNYASGRGRGHSEPSRGRWVPRGGRLYRGRGRGRPFRTSQCAESILVSFSTFSLIILFINAVFRSSEKKNSICCL